MGGGLLAAIGVFTASYGHGRPYRNRAMHMSVIAVAIALSTALGVWASVSAVTATLTIAVIAGVATFLCQSLQVEPPGAYLFVLVCAAGTGMADAQLDPLSVFGYVLAGGLFCCVVDAAGVLIDRRGPERAAIRTADRAVTDYVASIGTAREDAARQRAASALYESWAVLVTYQPRRSPPDPQLLDLRRQNMRLHLRFAGADDAGFEPPEVLARPSLVALMRVSLRPGSRPLWLAARAAVATALAGGVASLLGVEHAYWAASVALLLLHQDLDWLRTIQKGVQRLIGTFAGVLLAGAVLLVHPQGLWLVLVVGVLKAAIQLTTTRNYALSVLFVTTIAMTLAFAAVPHLDIPGVMFDRGCDTVIGAISAIVVFAATTRFMDAARLADAVDATLTACADVVALDELTMPAARAARRNLHVLATGLLPTFEAARGGPPEQSRAAERMWPAVVLTQRLAHRVLEECWAAERAEIALPREDLVAEVAAVRDFVASTR